MDERRIVDEEIGAHLLESIIRKERGSFTCLWESEEIAIEAFDEPLVVQRVDVLTNDPAMALTFPYSVKAPLNFKTLTLDEWDRFHGRTIQGIPFVFSRKAQMQFFDLLEEFDDDSVTFAGQSYPITPWLDANPVLQTEEFWTSLYQRSKDAWELSAPANALTDMLPRLKLPKCRVLVLGAGRGNDAAFFAEAGHIVTAVDISPEAIKQGKERYTHLPNINWVEADLFKLPREWEGNFDLIFEHTCYCAIDPAERPALVKTWIKLLSPKGLLMGVFFVMDRPAGPPYGGTEWELRERLKKNFQFQFWGRWKQSETRRQGTELFVYAEKR